MDCKHVQELLPDILLGPAAGLEPSTPEIEKHLASCAACSNQLAELRKTMVLLDEWQAPEPSPYFDTRLQARLREEMAKPQAGWLAWFRRPVLAASLTVLMGLGVGLFFARSSGIYQPGDGNRVAIVDAQQNEEVSTGVTDLQALDKNHDLYSDFEVLDDLEDQQNVTANP